MSYHVIMNSYGHLVCVRTKEYNQKVKELLEWGYGAYYVEAVIKNPESIEFEKESTIETKEELLRDLADYRENNCWDDSEEEIEKNISFIESVLAE